jgi:hypothetical protein
MAERVKIFAIALLLAAMLTLVGFFAGWSFRGHRQQPPVADTIRIHTVDTFRLPAPQPDTVTSIVTRYVSVPVYVRDTDTIREPAVVPLPFERRFARLEDVADVWYSGFQPRIDSAVVYRHRLTEIVRQPYEVTRSPLLGIELGVAAFYSEKRVSPCLFAAMRYNSPRMAVTGFGAVDHQGRWAVGCGVSYKIDLIR